jgi:hypothetical protein
MARNERFETPVLAVQVTFPTTPVSGGPCRLGQVCGVAVDAERADGLTVVDFTPGKVWSMAVKGEDSAGANIAVAIGDRIYMDTDGELNRDNTNGVLFGYALEAVTSGATATIMVMVEHN